MSGRVMFTRCRCKCRQVLCFSTCMFYITNISCSLWPPLTMVRGLTRDRLTFFVRARVGLVVLQDFVRISKWGNKPGICLFLMLQLVHMFYTTVNHSCYVYLRLNCSSFTFQTLSKVQQIHNFIFLTNQPPKTSTVWPGHRAVKNKDLYNWAIFEIRRKILKFDLHHVTNLKNFFIFFYFFF